MTRRKVAGMNAPVLAFKQVFQLLLQFAGPAILLGCLERVHRRAVVPPESVDELTRRPREAYSDSWELLAEKIS